ncbi:MAG: diaminopimelate epimerase [Methylobacteriaceae bacterium]|nr:diaminopimelate epimerase [Methylobacteriaceae bacterium]
MNPLDDRPFLKMNGLGNEIVVVDLRGAGVAVTAAAARAIDADPRLKFDQLMEIRDPARPGGPAFVRIWNSDGSEAGACGNGTRCVAWAMLRGAAPDRLVVETVRGPLACVRLGEWTFSVDMGTPRLKWDEIPLRDPFHDTRGIELQIGPIDAPVLHTPAVVNMGNPHAIFFVDDVTRHDLGRFGPLLENHPIFPDRANITLAQVEARDHVTLRVWERGAGLTRACGSAACATVVAGVRKKLLERRATASLPGGDLVIEWRASDDHVIMTGPVELEFEGRFDPALFAGVPA